MKVWMEVSVGELIDRTTILRIKLARLPKAVRADVQKELEAAEQELERIGGSGSELAALTNRLQGVNLELWEAEEELRASERAQEFGARFVELARSVYLANDRRAALKRRIDLQVGSSLREHKSHALPEV